MFWNECVNEEFKLDLILMFVHGESICDMDPMEYLGNLIFFIVGGNDIIWNSISGGLFVLNQFLDEFRKFWNEFLFILNMVFEIICW